MRFVIPYCLFFSALVVCAQPPTQRIFNFNFVLNELPPQRQIDISDSLGFDGLMLSVLKDDHVSQLPEFFAHSKVRTGDFKIEAVYFPCDAREEKFRKRLLETLPAFANTNTYLWLAIRGDENDRQTLNDFITWACKEAARQNIQVAIYPHDRMAIESAEEALTFVKELRQPNLSLTIQLNQEFRFGNEKRLDEVVSNTVSHVTAVGVSGTDRLTNFRDESRDWSDVVQPIADSTFDVEVFYKMLAKSGYDGPIGVQNWKIPGDPALHLSQSLTLIKKWQSEHLN